MKVGARVQKKSGKPFKSTLKINTVKTITVNPNTQREAFTFEEDESIMDAHQCEPAPKLLASKEWFESRIDMEENLEIGAGIPTQLRKPENETSQTN